MIINPANARMWSRLGPRGTFGLALFEQMQNVNNIVALSADLAVTSGFAKIRDTFQDRFLNTGIAEQNMVGVAAGIAREGYNVFCSTFATFASMRAFEMAKLNLGYMGSNVKLIGLTAGFGMGMFGNTHYATEDIALMRTISNLCVVSPADCAEVVKTVEALANYPGPVYVRLTGTASNPVVYSADYEFDIGKAITLSKDNSSDVAIIATGSMVHQAVEAAKLLRKDNIKVTVIDMHTIKPLDVKTISSVIDCDLIVTVEEHSAIGGLGGAVAEELSSRNCRAKLLAIGADDRFIHAGTYKYMLEQNGLVYNKIAEKIRIWL